MHSRKRHFLSYTYPKVGYMRTLYVIKGDYFLPSSSSAPRSAPYCLKSFPQPHISTITYFVNFNQSLWTFSDRRKYLIFSETWDILIYVDTGLFGPLQYGSPSLPQVGLLNPFLEGSLYEKSQFCRSRSRFQTGNFG